MKYLFNLLRCIAIAITLCVAIIISVYVDFGSWQFPIINTFGLNKIFGLVATLSVLVPILMLINYLESKTFNK